MGEIIIASAGPISNLMLVAIFLVLFRIFFRNPLISPDALGEMAQPIAMMLGIGMSLNIILAVFNLIPVPPLDGSHVLRNLLPDSLAEKYEQIPAWAGFIVLFLLVRVGFTSLLTTPIFNLVEKILSF
ncbi:MAG: site-2 protease family protein [Acidobacteria bacterium]|nr:site-2 protease family protein [Acidobacteriota bacterium]